jgi:uncharacterized protein YndB with AHSA1/START domain
MSTDRIEKKILLRAPLERVWRAIADPAEFGAWFGMKVEGPFQAGAKVRATITATTVDPEVAKAQKQHSGIQFELLIERVEPERLFSFRWHPGPPDTGTDRGVDREAEPTTLVSFALEPAAGGVLLTVSESGFDRIPIERRAKAFASNNEGWSIMVKMIEGYLAGAPQLENHARAN